MEKNETIEIGKRIPVWGEILEVVKSDRQHPFCDNRCFFSCDDFCIKSDCVGPCWSMERSDNTDVVFIKIS